MSNPNPGLPAWANRPPVSSRPAPSGPVAVRTVAVRDRMSDATLEQPGWWERVKAATPIALRAYTTFCGFSVIGFGVYGWIQGWRYVNDTVSTDCAWRGGNSTRDNCEPSMYIGFGSLFAFTYEVAFGALVVATEYHLSCVSRYFGFVSGHLGRGCFLVLCGTL